MPIYEYVCDKCGKKSEEVVLPGQEEPSTCPCGSEIHKVPSTCSFKIIWKGVDPKNFYDSEGRWLPDKDPVHGL